MFRKAVRIKTNTHAKSSERKCIKEKFMQNFPNLTTEDADELLCRKDTAISIMKIVTSSNEVVVVYSVSKRAMAFEVNGLLLPTIFLLWKLPNLVPSFTTHAKVISFLASGADLLLPGVMTPPANSGLSKYGNLPQGGVAYVNTSDNKAAVAVGITAQSSTDMVASGGRGRCLKIWHMYGDRLCNLDGVPNITIVSLGPPDWLQLKSYNEDFPQLGSPKTVTEDNTFAIVVDSETAEISETEQSNGEESTQVNEESPQVEETVTPVVISNEEMDKLLTYCFFVAIKYSKTISLPILTSNFYKLQMIPVCPQGKTIDLKKSSFKKLKPFLDSMCKDGIITTKEVKKGVESITAINRDHPKYTEFYIEPALRPKREEEGENAPSTTITESYIITANVLPIFANSGLNKGDTVQMNKVRQLVVDYVKKHNCQNEENKRLVKPKEALIKICKTENPITWEELMEKVCDSMKSCFKVTSGTEETISKGKPSPIVMSISQRSGNKKVTLVDNLELYGVIINEFAKDCQHGVAASTSISRPPGKKCDQLLVQGNQVTFIHSLLTGKYKIPARYIRGLELAPKRK